MYWLNLKRKKASIERSSLDGKHRQSIISQDLHRPRSLIVKGTYIFWMDQLFPGNRRGFKLERYNIGTGTRDIICQHEETTFLPFAMDISDNFETVYWSDWQNLAIWKMDLHFSNSGR